jgi:hypothetical protein
MPKPKIPSIDILAQQAVDILLQSGSHEPLLFIYTMMENVIAPIAFMPDSSEAEADECDCPNGAGAVQKPRLNRYFHGD